jgi:hypothetical protein
MAQVDELLREYKQAHRAGSGDPRPFLSRAPAADRAVLAALIEGYLENTPRREFDREEFLESAAAPVAEGVQRSLAGAGGLWPALLPRLRAQARVKRADLVRELAARLGAESQQAKVAGYYHEMEQGLLPAEGVSDTVLEALGKIVGVAAESLRKAGSLPAPGPPRMDEAAVFTRTARAAPDTASAPPVAAQTADDGTQEWDEIDRLFRGS